MRSCILFSGGWDSVAVALKIKDADLLFINYGQKYYDNELKAVLEFNRMTSRPILVHPMELKHDIERRNFYLLLEAKKLGYQRVYTGNRNVFPWWDKYRDSNWLTLKIFGWLSNLQIKMPIVCWGKSRIVNFVGKSYDGKPYNCYNNKTNYLECDCQNCLELRNIRK